MRRAVQQRIAAFVVGGTADEAFRPAELETSQATTLALDGADHGLEVDDPPTSARLLADTLDRLRTFVARTTAGGEPGESRP